jgi:hypothetical protein
MMLDRYQIAWGIQTTTCLIRVAAVRFETEVLKPDQTYRFGSSLVLVLAIDPGGGFDLRLRANLETGVNRN